MQLKYLTCQDQMAWDKLVQGAQYSGFMQSWAWSVLKEQCGQTVLRLGLWEKESLVGGAILYVVASSLGTSPLMIPQGPVLDWSDMLVAQQGWALLFAEIQTIASQLKSPVLRVEPAVSADMVAGLLPYARRAPIDLVPTPTRLIDIDRSDAEILAQMKPKGRYNIKKASEKGVRTVWGVSTDMLDEFFELFELTCLRHKFSGEGLLFFQSLLQHLAASGMLRIYLTSYKGVVTSAAIMIFYGRTATYLYGGSLPFMPQAMSSYDLHWTALRDARAQGCLVYDLYGVAPEDNPTHPYAQFSAFKEKFGGRRVTHAGAQDIIFYKQFSEAWLKQMESLAVN